MPRLSRSSGGDFLRESTFETTVSAARNGSYDLASVRKALRDSLDSLEPLLPAIARPGHRVLVKVNLGCSGSRSPAHRLTTHPAVAQAIIEALLDCGARVSFGDDVSRAGQYCEAVYKATGMAEVADRTGATLIDFVATGAREIPSGLLFPSSYLVTNAYFESDVVVNAANCRSGPVIVGMSAAIKNMFGCVVGRRKQHIHDLFGSDQRQFARAIADIHQAIPADISFLDMTTVLEGFGVTPAVQPVGLLLAGTDPVALDTVAAHSIGYERLPMWTTFYGHRQGIGCNDMDRIRIRGIEWSTFEKLHLRYPLIEGPARELPRARATRILNNTMFRQRPVIDAGQCGGCGECADRCPVKCISAGPGSVCKIDLGRCVDCLCCTKVCETGAVHLEVVGAGRAFRRLIDYAATI